MSLKTTLLKAVFFGSEKATNSDHSQLFKSTSYKIIQISMIFLELFKNEKNKKNEKAKNCCEIAYYLLDHTHSLKLP